MDALDRSAMELLDRAALELSDRKRTDPDADPLAVTDPSAATDRYGVDDPLAAADPSGVADPLTTEHGHTPGETGETKSPDLARAIDFDLSTSQPTRQRNPLGTGGRSRAGGGLRRAGCDGARDSAAR